MRRDAWLICSTHLEVVAATRRHADLRRWTHEHFGGWNEKIERSRGFDTRFAKSGLRPDFVTFLSSALQLTSSLSQRIGHVGVEYRRSGALSSTESHRIPRIFRNVFPSPDDRTGSPESPAPHRLGVAEQARDAGPLMEHAPATDRSRVAPVLCHGQNRGLVSSQVVRRSGQASSGTPKHRGDTNPWESVCGRSITCGSDSPPPSAIRSLCPRCARARVAPPRRAGWSAPPRHPTICWGWF